MRATSLLAFGYYVLPSLSKGSIIIIIIIIIIMGQLKRMDARTYIHERWASRT